MFVRKSEYLCNNANATFCVKTFKINGIRKKCIIFANPIEYLDD